MKKVLNIGIGGKSFVIDEDAYNRLNGYLKKFQSKIGMIGQNREVMDELEERIAELFSERINSKRDVVNISMVENVIAQLGMPDGSEDTGYDYEEEPQSQTPPPVRRLYRDMERKVFGGVCGGLAYYLNLDIVLVRVLMILLFLFGSIGFWLYIIMWIAVPAARTARQKCEMEGLPVTFENIRKFHDEK